eukprot:6212881-Pleurochrysis_carterae.AAC.1
MFYLAEGCFRGTSKLTSAPALHAGGHVLFELHFEQSRFPCHDLGAAITKYAKRNLRTRKCCTAGDCALFSQGIMILWPTNGRWGSQRCSILESKADQAVQCPGLPLILLRWCPQTSCGFVAPPHRRFSWPGQEPPSGSHWSSRAHVGS